jgi:hypothetical protein
MSVNLEVKGSLAKCLATENLIVEHKKVPTACFDVDRRVLTLPTWDRASATVYDLLVGHEVGHALFTDNIDWTEEYPEVPKDFVNVVEDVRVERLMKKKYPGLSKTFYNGYNELNDQDFFSTKDEDLNKLSFIDRINMYFKIGAFHNIEFNDDENEFLTRISKVETFKEVLDISRELVEYLKYRREQLPEMPSNVPMSDEMGSGQEVELPQDQSTNQPGQSEMESQPSEQEDGELNRTEAPTGEKMDSEGNGMDNQNGRDASNKHGDLEDELKSKTSRSFDEKSQNLVDKFAQETAYVELPEVILENVVIPNEWVHQKCSEFYNNAQESDGYGTWWKESLKICVQEYKEFKKTAEKEVSYLVKEFECKKSADQYARASTARTGVLDTQKLHTYKFNEDLFKKVSVIPDGKNHGLVFILDWSGSMQDWILDTCKQLFSLIWFCRKVNIPFEVYAFTLDCNSYVELQPNHPQTFKKVKDVIALESSFRLMNFFTSSVSNRVLEEQMQNVWKCAYSFQKRAIGSPRHMDLSGSPIGESIICLHKIIPHFQQKNKLQKVNVVFLTDGEGYVNAATKEKKNGRGETFVGFTKYNKTNLRDRKTGRIYSSYDYGNFPVYAKVLLQSVKDRFPMVNLVNFRITPSREFQNCYRWYGNDYNEYETAKKKFNKDSFITFKNTGFDQFNVIASNTLSQDESFEVQEGASKAQIKTAFSKMLNKKKTNKKLLSEFIGMIA